MTQINLHLFIPALFWPDTSQHDIYDNLSLPTLEALLAKSVYTEHQSSEIDAWLCNTFNISKQQNWPVAAIMSQIDNPIQMKNSKDYWIRADPVHLRIEQNHIMLADSQTFQITMEEAKQYTNILNQHLSEDRLTLLPLQPERWYIHATNVPLIQTHTLNQVTCENINNFLPSGDEYVVWHRYFNEIQMLLHEHPLNQAREDRGELAINSVWFWGGGTLPPSVESPYTQIWSDDDFPRALAVTSKTQHTMLPTDATTWQQSAKPGNHLVVLDGLQSKSKYKDAHGWQLNMRALEKNWFAPLCDALQKGSINQLMITSIHGNTALNFTIRHPNLWKFWLTRKPVSTYIMNLA